MDESGQDASISRQEHVARYGIPVKRPAEWASKLWCIGGWVRWRRRREHTVANRHVRRPGETGRRIRRDAHTVAMTSSTSANDSLADIPQLAGVTHVNGTRRRRLRQRRPVLHRPHVRLSLAGTIARARSSTRASPKKSWRDSGWVAAGRGGRGRDPVLQRYAPCRSSASARCQFSSSVPPSPDWEMW